MKAPPLGPFAKEVVRMAFDSYAACPCGSGKKFKWCCQPIHVDIDRAFSLDNEGQYDAALRLLDQVLAAHPDNPEAWGRKAQLLYQHGKTDEAERTLEKAFELNRDYPFGHWLKAMFRHAEGELRGAMLLLRRAAELYDPQARDYLAQIYALIADIELRLNNPVAARAALEAAAHLQPDAATLREDLERLFGDKARLPRVARQPYSFQSPPAAAPAERRKLWDQSLSGTKSGRLKDAVRVFDELTTQSADDDDAWYNLGLARAWLGENAAAIEALDRYVTLEQDEIKAGEAWALAEVLRCGQGLEDDADYVLHSVFFEIRDPQAVSGLLQRWHDEGRLGLAKQEQEVFVAVVLEKPAGLTPEHAASKLVHLACDIAIIGRQLQLSNAVRERLELVRHELQEAVGPAVSPPQNNRSPARFTDVLAEVIVFPARTQDEAQAVARVREHEQRYFEETWVHRELRALALTPPIDAAGHPALRKKLRGVIRFLEDCVVSYQGVGYDFDRLRRKLGLLPDASPTSSARDISNMAAAELAALVQASTSDHDLELAYQAALQLDARDLAGRFAQTLVGRPPQADRPDRWPYYTHLTELALADGDSGAALTWVDAGQQYDSQHNAGRRQNDYDLRRGQLLIKRGSTEEAQSVFDRIIERAPGELRYRGTATEAMLSAREGKRALHFAQPALARAREKNDRDSEQYFLELISAAQKQGG